MSYATQGTVRLELKTADDARFFVNPTPDYALKRDNKSYIVFVEVEPSPFQARVFETTKPFKCQEPHFIDALRQAAFGQSKIEIKMDVGCEKIESLTIPASS